MMCAWFMHERRLPPTFAQIVVMGLIVLTPALLIVEQPDLGTALLVVAAGGLTILLAGISVRVMLAFGVLGLATLPVLWMFMRDYQKARIFTFLNPESDPLGTGYNIIQSKIAIGSGGLFGKGWLNGSQSHLEFLPERSTDFIFAVMAEEFGLLGLCLLIVLYLALVGRGLYIAAEAQDTFSRLLAGALSPDVLRLRVRQRRHGVRPPADRRRAVAARQRRRHFDGDPAGGFRYARVDPRTSEVVGGMTHGSSPVRVILVVRSSRLFVRCRAAIRERHRARRVHRQDGGAARLRPRRAHVAARRSRHRPDDSRRDGAPRRARRAVVRVSQHLPDRGAHRGRRPLLDGARRSDRANRRTLRCRARDDRRDRRHRDVLRHAHGPLSRARRARDAGVRVSAARAVLHVGARVVSAAHARGGRRADGSARLVRRRDGRGAVHSVELSRLRRRRRRRRQARSLDQLGRRARQRRELLRQARLAGRRARHAAGRALGALRRRGAEQQPRARRHRRLDRRDGLRVHDDVADGRAGSGLFARGRGRRLGVLGRLPQLPRRDALQPQHEVRAGGAPAERGHPQPLRRGRRQ